MKNRKYLLLLTSLILLVIISACSNDSSSGDDESLDLEMSVTTSESSTWHQAAEKFAEDIENESDGRITIDVFTDEQLSGGDSGKAVELLSKGKIDLTFNSTIIYSALDERFGVVSAPFLFKDLSEVDEVLEGEGGENIQGIVRDNGVEPLGFGEGGFRQVTNSEREIQSPEDIEGLKIRVPGITMYTDLWQELGTDPTTMTFSEVFTSLQQNTIDGQENPIDVIHSSKLDEVQDYITMWNYSYDPLILGINQELFESLNDDDQKMFQEIGEKAGEYQVNLSREEATEQEEELKEKGMEFYYPEDNELEEFKDVVQPVYEKYESIWGEDLLDSVTP